MTVARFNQYVERILEIPPGVDPGKITTGVVYNPDGSFSHVPTEVFQQEGKWYARINSLTNSPYTVVWNPLTVASVEGHWSQAHVNDMASRLVVENTESFDPDKPISRADFAGYITRALGVYRSGASGTTRYSDVSAWNPAAAAITIAADYRIISGYPDGTFGPDRTITREEAMTMFAKAMDIVGLQAVPGSHLGRYQDREQVSDWATAFVNKSVGSGIFRGRTAETIDPQGVFTQAEAATAIRNLLRQSQLINQ